jgi:hypothetical protein
MTCELNVPARSRRRILELGVLAALPAGLTRGAGGPGLMAATQDTDQPVTRE